MAGKIEQGFGEEAHGEEDAFINTVHIETDAFSANAIGLYDMPGLQVIDVFSTPGIAQMPKMVDLLRLSIYDPERAEDLSILSFSELAEVVAQWVAKSQNGAATIDFGTLQ